MSGYISKNSGTHHQSLSTLGTFLQRPDSIGSKWNIRHAVHQSFKKQKPFPESSLILVSKLDQKYHCTYHIFYIFVTGHKESRNKSKNSLKSPVTYTTSSQPQLYPFFTKQRQIAGSFYCISTNVLTLVIEGFDRTPQKKTADVKNF